VIVNLTDQLIRDEALRLFAYDDATGLPLKPGDTLKGNLTIGVGRNLNDVGISLAEAKVLLLNDVANAIAQMEKAFPWSTGLDEVRHAALANMTFNMGVGRLSQFKNFLAAMAAGDWKTARNEMLDSLWAKQVGARAQRLAIQIDTGAWQ